MPSRGLLVTALLCVVLLAAGIGAASNGDGEVTINKTGETAIVEVAPCDSVFCRFAGEPYDLYVNGEYERSLGHGDEYRVRDSDYTDGKAGVAVSDTNLVKDDEGWGYLIERTYPEEQASDGEGEDRRDNQSSARNVSTDDGSPPEVIVDPSEVDEFGDCMAKDRLRFFDPRLDEDEEEYCFDDAF